MNYIVQINYYWQKHEELSLSRNECALYMYLLKRLNSSGWRNPIQVRNSVAMEILNLNFRELQSSRDRLQSYNLIRFKTTNGLPVVVYMIYDAESRGDPATFYKTFAPNAKVTAKVSTKVPAKVDTKVEDEVSDSSIVLDKYKQKQKDDDDEHENFLNDFLKPENEFDREAICLQSHVAEIKKKWLEIFNAHLVTERKHHADYREWLKHLRYWLNIKLPELKNLKNDYRNEIGLSHGTVKVDFEL